ncbi:MAG: M42 family metallopeptidase [Candidatus Omnitrophica bacterium]|nr:M42 family metallopeptidase [Candidatus Omnitrophota bacterium]MCB9722036.1 M42 family metallopeptidase [Candidatus Omnitrophota bacterium]
MNAESKKFLIELLSQCGPSGFEEAPQNVWIKRAEKFAHKTYKDIHGNAFAVLNPKASFKVMLSGHCDEIGFIVSHISDDGFLHVIPIGGIDPGTLPGTQVKVLTEAGHVDGVIGKKAIHLTEPEERKNVLPIKEMWVDIGAKDKQDALKTVQPGHPVTFAPNFIELANNRFSSKSADNRTGAFVVNEVIKILSERELGSDVGVYAVSTVQEEVGLRGAVTSSFGIEPKAAFAVDVGHASDMPDIDKRLVGDVSLGKGPLLHAGPVINRVLGRMLVETAKAKKIPYQFASLGRPGGTDTAAIQVSRSGVATALVAVPTRYMHTMVETCSYNDCENAAKLIADTIMRLSPQTDFTP